MDTELELRGKTATSWSSLVDLSVIVPKMLTCITELLTSKEWSWDLLQWRGDIGNGPPQKNCDECH
jgi:hypothetical protein